MRGSFNQKYLKVTENCSIALSHVKYQCEFDHILKERFNSERRSNEVQIFIILAFLFSFSL